MKPEEVSILFMDDEIGDGTAVMVSTAVEALRNCGYDVDCVDTMSAAVDAFYRKFYQVFVLDIDMSRIEDLLSRQRQRGSHEAEIYRGLDNHAEVIMYSARGTVEDLFRVGNRHVSGYVHKESHDSVGRLLDAVHRAVERQNRNMELPSPRASGAVLIACDSPPDIPQDELSALVAEAGDYHGVFCPLAEMTARLASEEFVAAMVVSRQISTRPPMMAIIDRICAMQPRPHVVIACEGRDDSLESLLSLVNARPFRLVNLLATDWRQSLVDAIRAAARWRGGNETFSVDSGYLHRAAEDIDWETLGEQLHQDGDSAADPQGAAPGFPEEP